MRLVQLDVLRAIAVFLVILRHLGQGKQNAGIVGFLDKMARAPNDWAHLPEAVFRHVYQCGWMGVDLFFVLSGFLVSGLLFHEYRRHGNLYLQRFLFRRGLKIYPAFYVFLAGSAVAIGMSGTRHESAAAWCSEALFVQNYGPNIWGHTWSLAVEEHFYLMLGLFLWFLARRGGVNPFSSVPLAFVIVAVVELAARVITGLVYPEFEHKTHVFPTHLRVDSLFFGVLLSYFHHFDSEKLAFVKNWRGIVTVASTLLIVPALFLRQGDFRMYTVGLTALYMGFGGLLVVALSFDDFKNSPFAIAATPIARIGVFSYSIYLWHLPVLVVCVPLCARLIGRSLGLPVEMAIYMVGSVVVGIVMAQIVEMPALKFRDRVFPTRAS